MTHDDRKYETGPLDHKISQIVSLERFKDERSHYFQSLTDREKNILGLVAQGMKTSDIAAQLAISSVTVQNHRSSIRQKLLINRESDYFRYAYAFDLVEF